MHEKIKLSSGIKMTDYFNFTHENENFMYENEDFAQKMFMGKNSMHEVEYIPTTHEQFWMGKIMPGAKSSFSCMEISFSCMENFNFVREHIKSPCMKMKISCNDFLCRKPFSG